jgi:hypothetical protein
MRQIKTMLNRIIVIAMIFITLMFFVLKPPVEAAKLPKDGEFYYAGTTQGNYVVSQGIFSWLLDALKGLADFILGAISMLFRMVIVGWTALAEMVLTNILEASMGVDMTVGDVDATDISASTDSRQNVTVEAIVYNLVPLFNVNLFRTTEEETIRTGTGRDLSEYVCDRCEKSISECDCTESECNCNLCQLRRFREDPDNKTAVDIVKDSVIEWYYIIRLIAIAAMLLVLLGIGIKMAISTVASEKALYKRMIVDWVVGFIILFTVHYMMIAIITVNEVLVDVVKDAANTAGNDVAEITKKEFNVKEKTNSDLEISIYEATRTRAYDAKLINGTTGMVMYATLVFFAYKYSLIYLKRYLTIIALTLMAPGAGLAYALQKALSGKSKAFSNWLKEYFMNVIIQSVHALLYSSFVSMALVISLNSVSGMIIAFILLNFMSKGDKMLRKIFKMSSEGSLLDNAESSGDMSKIKSNLQTAHSLYMGAKPVTKALMHSPITKAVAGTARAIRNEAILGAARAKDFVENSDSAPAQAMRTAGNAMAEAGQGVANLISKGADTKIPVVRALGKAFRRAGLDSSQDEEILKKLTSEKEGNSKFGRKAEENALKEALLASNEVEQARKSGKSEDEIKKLIATASKKWDNYHNVKRQNARVRRIQGATVTGAIGSHIGRLLNVNNYYKKVKDSDGKIHRVRIGSKFGTIGKNGKIRTGILSRRTGTFVWDEKNAMPKYMSVGDLISHQLSSEQLLGLSKEDKKAIGEVSKFIGTGMVGMASVLIGMGSFVENPKLGLPLLAAGTAASTKMLGRNLRKSNYATKTSHVYSFGRFSGKAPETIVRQLKESFDEERKALDEISKGVGDLKRLSNTNNDAENINISSIQSVYDRVSAEKPGVIRRTVGDRFFGGITGQMDILGDQQLKEIDKKAKQQEQLAIVVVSDNLQRDYMKRMEELEKMLETTQTDEQIQRQDVGFNEIRVSDDKVISFGNSKENAPEKAVDTIIEHSILQFAVAHGRLDITQTDINNESAKSQIKQDIEQSLAAAGIIQKDQQLDTVVPDLEKRMLDIKARLDKEEKKSSNPKGQDLGFDSETQKKLEAQMSKIEELVLQNTIKDYISKNGISSVSEINGDEVLNLYKNSLSKMKVKSPKDVKNKEEKTREQVKDILATLQETKRVAMKGGKQKAASIDEIKEMLTKAALHRDVEKVQKLGGEPGETVKVDKKDKDQKTFREVELIEEYGTAMAAKRNGEVASSAVVDMGLTDKQSEKVLELLLLQKEMKKLNQRAIEVKMTPVSDMAHERARKVKAQMQMTDGSRKVDSSKTGDRIVGVKTRKENMTYGPVNNIIDLINGGK